MSSWSRKEDSPAFEIAELIVSGIIPIGLIAVGTIGNIISIWILLSKENRRYSTNVYLIFLCLMDTISLYQWNMNHIMFTFTKGRKQVWSNSLVLCKLSEFFAFYTLHTSAMFLSMVELDRACLLRSNWYKRKVARARIAFCICLGILIVLFGLNGFLFAVGTEFPIYDSVTGQLQMVIVACYYTLDATLMDFFANSYPWIHLVVMYFLPFSIIIICTLITVRKLICHRRLNDERFESSANRNRRISIMLLLMCLTYVISTLPNRLCFSVFTEQLVGHDYTDTVFLATNTLMYTRNAINAFFLYISVHGYRRDVRNLFLKCIGKPVATVVPMNTISMVGDAARFTTAVQTVSKA